jgi:hypothetical protein
MMLWVLRAWTSASKLRGRDLEAKNEVEVSVPKSRPRLRPLLPSTNYCMRARMHRCMLALRTTAMMRTYSTNRTGVNCA